MRSVCTDCAASPDKYSNQASFWHSFVVYKQPRPRSRQIMLFSLKNVFPIRRAEPARWIELRQGQFVGQVNLVECDVAEDLVIAHPAAVRVQPNPCDRQRLQTPSQPCEFFLTISN